MDFIPSRHVAKHCRDIAWEFSDRDKAALTLHWGRSFEAGLSALERLKSELGDEKVISDIDEYIASERAELARFEQEGDGIVFVLQHYDEEYGDWSTDGLFASAEDAVERGKRLGSTFEITKALVVPRSGSLPRAARAELNPYMVEGVEDKGVDELVSYPDEDDDDGQRGTATYAAGGTLLRVWCASPDEPDKEQLMREHDPERFYNAFVELPNPFEAGDIVQLVPAGTRSGGDVAVVSTSQAEWAKYMERVRTKDLPYDFSDCGITILVVGEDGRISHEHVPVAYLEPCGADTGEADPALVEALVDIVKHGAGEIDWLLLQYDRVRHGAGKKNGNVSGFDIVEM